MAASTSRFRDGSEHPVSLEEQLRRAAGSPEHGPRPSKSSSLRPTPVPLFAAIDELLRTTAAQPMRTLDLELHATAMSQTPGEVRLFAAVAFAGEGDGNPVLGEAILASAAARPSARPGEPGR
jgi:hypothetical protein